MQGSSPAARRLSRDPSADKKYPVFHELHLHQRRRPEPAEFRERQGHPHLVQPHARLSMELGFIASGTGERCSPLLSLAYGTRIRSRTGFGHRPRTCPMGRRS
jgi:hypothetical protein